MQQDIRWVQRFQNFDRAVVLLREPIARDVTTATVTWPPSRNCTCGS